MMRKFTSRIGRATLLFVLSQIQKVIVLGKDAVAELEQRRQTYARTGLYPVMLGDNEDIQFNSKLSGRYSVQKIILESLKIDVNEWFREALREFEEAANEDAEVGEIFEGEWPDDVTVASGLSIQYNLLTRQPRDEIIIGLLNIKEPWEAFAALNWGGWNACPRPAEHCAIHRYWYEKYGAEVTGITTDVVECIVTKPPSTREESLELAKEQYFYCNDIVDHDVGAISYLAATLMHSRYWYFWWD